MRPDLFYNTIDVGKQTNLQQPKKRLDIALPLKHNTYMNKLTSERRAQVIGALIEGNSIRSTCRMTGVCKDAVLKLIADMGAACAEFHDSAVRGVSVQRVQCDEVWSFCYAKAKNVPEEKKSSGAGDVWTWTAIDADTKLIISYLC